MIYEPTAMLRCPHCDEEFDNPADDFAIGGRTGIESEGTEQCGFCDEWFTCIRLANGKIEVEAIDENAE